MVEGFVELECQFVVHRLIRSSSTCHLMQVVEAEAISGTELPKGLNLVQQTMAQLRTKIVSAIETLSGENEK